jgi:hypothetical protein
MSVNAASEFLLSHCYSDVCHWLEFQSVADGVSDYCTKIAESEIRASDPMTISFHKTHGAIDIYIACISLWLPVIYRVSHKCAVTGKRPAKQMIILMCLQWLALVDTTLHTTSHTLWSLGCDVCSSSTHSFCMFVSGTRVGIVQK